MKNFNYKYLLIVFSILAISCSDDADYGLDSNKVVPHIFDFAGPTVEYIDNVAQYSISPRAGSDYIWTVNGAQLQTIDGHNSKINVLFNQYIDPVSVSVQELAANGQTSEISTMNVVVFGPTCDWRIDMFDSFGDGWNGASLSITFDGVFYGEITIDDGAYVSETIPVPDGSVLEVTFASGAWDEEITYSIYDGSQTLVFADGPTPTIGAAYTVTNSCP